MGVAMAHGRFYVSLNSGSLARVLLGSLVLPFLLFLEVFLDGLEEVIYSYWFGDVVVCAFLEGLFLILVACLPFLVYWYLDCECGAHAWLALGGDCASVSLDETFADGEAEPLSFRFGGEERLKQFAQVLFRHADACILYGYDCGIGCLVCSYGEFASFRHRLDAVHGEVCEDSPHQASINQHLPDALLDLNGDLHISRDLRG
jgi:hypothetical protein